MLVLYGRTSMEVSSAFAPIDILCFRALRGEGTTHSDIMSPGTRTCKFTKIRLLGETCRSCFRHINWFSQRSIFLNQPQTGKCSNGMVIGYFNEHHFDLGGTGRPHSHKQAFRSAFRVSHEPRFRWGVTSVVRIDR